MVKQFVGSVNEIHFYTALTGSQNSAVESEENSRLFSLTMHCPFISLIVQPHCIQRGLYGGEGLETVFNVGCAKSYLTSSAHLKRWRSFSFEAACKSQEEVDPKMYFGLQICIH